MILLEIHVERRMKGERKKGKERDRERTLSKSMQTETRLTEF